MLSNQLRKFFIFLFLLVAFTSFCENTIWGKWEIYNHVWNKEAKVWEAISTNIVVELKKDFVFDAYSVTKRNLQFLFSGEFVLIRDIMVLTFNNQKVIDWSFGLRRFRFENNDLILTSIYYSVVAEVTLNLLRMIPGIITDATLINLRNIIWKLADTSTDRYKEILKRWNYNAIETISL